LRRFPIGAEVQAQSQRLRGSQEIVLAPHATADDPSAYIDLERVEEERQRECVGRYEAYLRRLGLLSDEAAEAVRADAVQLMRDGIAAAEAEPPADPSLLFSHAFAEPPASFETDLAELRRILG